MDPRLSGERLVLAQRQLGQELSKKENTALLTDETSKFGEKYAGYHTANAEGSLWVLGLREIKTKFAQYTLSTYKEILQDIDDRPRASKNKTSMKILRILLPPCLTELLLNSYLISFYKTTKRIHFLNLSRVMPALMKTIESH